MTLGQKLLMKFLEVALCLCLAVFGCDILPALAAWVGRIHIGRFSDKESWRDAVEKKARKEIAHLPPIPVTDTDAYTIIPRFKGKYNNRHFLCWQEACLLLGLGGDEQATAAAKKFFDKSNVKEAEYTIGNAMLIFALLKSGLENDADVKAAADRYAAKMLELASGGTLPYNPADNSRFVDTLGMACPFLFLYDKLYGCPEASALAKKQLSEFFEFGIHPGTGLPIHCYNESTKAPMGVYGWGRGCGWLAIGLAESCKILGKDDDYRKIITGKMKSFADTLLTYQNDNGSFSSLLGADVRPDSSATAILGWFLARTARIFGDERCKNAAEKCGSYIVSVTRRNGLVDFAQGDTIGTGNYSRRFAPMPAAQGFALRIGK